jgi:hypothetical protein
MDWSRDEHLPEDLGRIADQLREQRVEVTPLELDRIKLRARAQASAGAARVVPRQKGMFVRSRIVTLMLVLGLMVSGGTAGVLAGGGGGGKGQDSQYKPGCGPKKSGGVNPSGTHTGQPPKSPNRGDCPQ